MSRVSTSIETESRLVIVNTQEREGLRVGTMGVGFLLVLCLVAPSCPTLCDPMDCSLTGSCVHGDSPGKNTGMGFYALPQGIFPTQR